MHMHQTPIWSPESAGLARKPPLASVSCASRLLFPSGDHRAGPRPCMACTAGTVAFQLGQLHPILTILPCSTHFSSALASRPHPLRELTPLTPDIHEPRPRLQYAERVTNEILLHLATAPEEALLALALDLARPHPPLDRPQLRGVCHEPQQRHDEARDRLDRDIDGEGGRRLRVVAMQGRARRSQGLER